MANRSWGKDFESETNKNRFSIYLNVLLPAVFGHSVEVNNLGGRQNPVLPRHLLRVEPVEPPVGDVVLYGVASVIQLELERRVSDADVLLAQVKLQLVAEYESALRILHKIELQCLNFYLYNRDQET